MKYAPKLFWGCSRALSRSTHYTLNPWSFSNIPAFCNLCYLNGSIVHSFSRLLCGSILEVSAAFDRELILKSSLAVFHRFLQDILTFFIIKYDECSSAGPKSYLLEMTSYVYFLGRSSVWWNVTRWGFGSWTVPDPQWRCFPRWEPNSRKLGPLPHPLHLTRAGQYHCYEPWGAAQGGRPHGHTRFTPSINLRNQCGCICVHAFGYVSTCPFFLQRHMHSYREAFEEMDGGPVSPPPIVGGEALPQTLAFPVSPQTPYFNLSKFPHWRRRAP